MSNTIQKKSGQVDILQILAFLVLARLSCPALSNIPFMTMSFTFVYGVAFLFVFFLVVKRITRREFTLFLIILVYTCYVIFQSLITGKGLFATDNFNAYVIMFLLTIYMWAKRQDRKTQMRLMTLIFVAMIFNHVYSIWVLMQDPNASRAAAAIGVVDKSPYDILNAVGSFDAVYGGLSVIVLLLCMYKCLPKADKKRWMLAIVLVLTFVFVIMASYATALVLLVMAFALLIGRRNGLLSACLIIAAVMMLVFHEPIGQAIMDWSVHLRDSRVLRERIHQIGEMLKTFEAAGTYSGSDGRAARMQWSLNTFWNYPIFGGFTVRGAKIGGHSEFLDMLGKYGIVGFGLVATFFANLYLEIKQRLHRTELQTACSVIFIIWVVAAILNPAMYTLQMLPIILMLPLSEDYCLDFSQPQ